MATSQSLVLIDIGNSQMRVYTADIDGRHLASVTRRTARHAAQAVEPSGMAIQTSNGEIKQSAIGSPNKLSNSWTRLTNIKLLYVQSEDIQHSDTLTRAKGDLVEKIKNVGLEEDIVGSRFVHDVVEKYIPKRSQRVKRVKDGRAGGFDGICAVSISSSFTQRAVEQWKTIIQSACLDTGWEVTFIDETIATIHGALQDEEGSGIICVADCGHLDMNLAFAQTAEDGTRWVCKATNCPDGATRINAAALHAFKMHEGDKAQSAILEALDEGIEETKLISFQNTAPPKIFEAFPQHMEGWNIACEAASKERDELNNSRLTHIKHFVSWLGDRAKKIVVTGAASGDEDLRKLLRGDNDIGAKVVFDSSENGTAVIRGMATLAGKPQTTSWMQYPVSVYMQFDKDDTSPDELPEVGGYGERKVLAHQQQSVHEAVMLRARLQRSGDDPYTVDLTLYSLPAHLHDDGDVGVQEFDCIGQAKAELRECVAKETAEVLLGVGRTDGCLVPFAIYKADGTIGTGDPPLVSRFYDFQEATIKSHELEAAGYHVVELTLALRVEPRFDEHSGLRMKAVQSRSSKLLPGSDDASLPSPREPNRKRDLALAGTHIEHDEEQELAAAAADRDASGDYHGRDEPLETTRAHRLRKMARPDPWTQDT